MKIRYFVSFAAQLLVLSISNTVWGEFRCSSEVSYKWVKQVERTQTPPATPEASTVHFANIEKVGADEVSAKASLADEVARQRARASKECKRDHESFGECLGRKFLTHKSTIDSLGFSARKEFERALTEECRGHSGSCSAVLASDPVCKEVVAPVAESAAAEKDKKGEEKKKK